MEVVAVAVDVGLMAVLPLHDAVLRPRLHDVERDELAVLEGEPEAVVGERAGEVQRAAVLDLAGQLRRQPEEERLALRRRVLGPAGGEEEQRRDGDAGERHEDAREHEHAAVVG